MRNECEKALGGPQAGIIAGRADLIARIKKNPLKRALRVDKMTIAALNQVLKLYKQPESLASNLPTLKHLARKPSDMVPLAERLTPSLEQKFSGHLCVYVGVLDAWHNKL